MAVLKVAIVYADRDQQYYQELQVPQGSSIAQVIAQSGYLQLAALSWFVPWYNAHQDSSPNHRAWHVGIYSVKKRLDTIVQDNDRIEIYRPLIYDPMTRRKSKSKTYQAKNKNPN